MTQPPDPPRGLGTCACERCGRYCHHQQSCCDSCQEVRRLREALDRIRDDNGCQGYDADNDIWDEPKPCPCAHCVSRRALEESPW